MDNKTETNFEDFINKGKISSRGKWIVAAVVFVFFVALIVVSIDWVLGALVHTRKEVKVPDITQKPVTAALNALAGANLALKQAGVEFAEGVPPGSVLRQIPSAGSTVREGRVVRVWISQGDEMVFVPAVSTFYISQKLGGTDTVLIGDVIESQFKTAYNPNLGAAMSLVLMILIFICVAVMNRFGEGDGEEVIKV